jgi:hypothetical protein
MKRYKKPLKSREEYFKHFTAESLKELTDEDTNNIYSSYYMRHTVFNRDNFKCQALHFNPETEKWEACKFDDSELTLHHYKHKSNKGKDSPRNGVTVCHAHQAQYHRGRTTLKFSDSESLPPHIRGHTQALHEYILKTDDDGEIRAVLKFTFNKTAARQLRKANKQLHGKRLTLEEIVILFIWLYKIAIEVEVDDTSPL